MHARGKLYKPCSCTIDILVLSVTYWPFPFCSIPEVGQKVYTPARTAPRNWPKWYPSRPSIRVLPSMGVPPGCSRYIIQDQPCNIIKKINSERKCSATQGKVLLMWCVISAGPPTELPASIHKPALMLYLRCFTMFVLPAIIMKWREVLHFSLCTCIFKVPSQATVGWSLEWQICGKLFLCSRSVVKLKINKKFGSPKLLPIFWWLST